MEVYYAHTAINLIIIFLLIIVATKIAISRDLMHATIYFSVFSLLMALIYIILNAPDVAITEASIGAGISTMLFLAALLLTGKLEKPKKIPVVTYLVFTGTVLALIFVMISLPPVGDASAPAQKHVAPYYIENTVRDTGIPNMVTAILASYRGYDTLGETFVIFTALIAVYMLLGFKTGRVEGK